MIDVANIKYRLVVMTEDKKQYNIKEFVENLGWEENDGELAVRISFTAKNDKTSAGLISSLAKPGCLVGVFGISRLHRRGSCQRVYYRLEAYTFREQR